MAKTEKINVLSTLVHYHEDIDTFIEFYGKLTRENLVRLIDELKTFTNNVLIRHFLFEELVVFPCIRAKIPATALRIGNYIREHREMISELHRIISDGSAETFDAAEKVIRMLAQHAVDEDKHIVQTMNSVPHLTLIMAREYLRNRVRLEQAPILVFDK